MQEIKRSHVEKVTVTNTVYIADDGKEFDTYYECYVYELNIKLSKLKSSLKVKQMTPPYLSDDNTNWLIYHVENQDDINKIQNYYDELSKDFGLNLDTSFNSGKNTFPNWIILEEKIQRCGIYYLGTMDEVYNDLEKYFKNVKEKIKLEENKNV